MPKIMEMAELVNQGGYRFVAVLTWPKENPDPEDKVHQDKIVKNKMADVLIQQPPEVQHTFTFNLSGERTLLITGYTLKPTDLYKFVKKITGEDGSGNLTHISVKFAPRQSPTAMDMVDNLGCFQGETSTVPGYYRFVAKLYWDPKDDQVARKTIADKVKEAQNQQIPGINPLIQCDILVGDQTAWIVGFTEKPSSLQSFISKIVYKGVTEAKVSHATTGPQVNTILNNING
jgi:hypothetical protein